MNTRKLAKEALKVQISVKAFELFKKNGFDKTTIQDISTSIGMSSRTYFRYFPSKEDVLLDSIYIFKSKFLEMFEHRLHSDDLWEAITYTLYELALNCIKPEQGDVTREIQEFIRETPALFARQLEIIEGLQQEATDLYISKNESDNNFRWHTVNAIIRLGFSCFQAAQSRTSNEKERDIFITLIEELRPAILVKKHN